MRRDNIIRITAVEKLQIYYVIGSVIKTFLLDKSNFVDSRISRDQACFIESTRHALVTELSLASEISNLGHPAMTVITGINQYLNFYKKNNT